MRFHSTEGNSSTRSSALPGSAIARYPRPSMAENPPGWGTGVQPERVLALEERGHRLPGCRTLLVQLRRPAPIRPRDLDVATGKRMSAIQPDVIYALLNWQASFVRPSWRNQVFLRLALQRRTSSVWSTAAGGVNDLLRARTASSPHLRRCSSG
jgi:hypothetical protein